METGDNWFNIFHLCNSTQNHDLSTFSFTESSTLCTEWYTLHLNSPVSCSIDNGAAAQADCSFVCSTSYNYEHQTCHIHINSCESRLLYLFSESWHLLTVLSLYHLKMSVLRCIFVVVQITTIVSSQSLSSRNKQVTF